MILKRASIIVISLFLIIVVLYVHRESFKLNALESSGFLTSNEASSWSDNRLRFEVARLARQQRLSLQAQKTLLSVVTDLDRKLKAPAASTTGFEHPGFDAPAAPTYPRQGDFYGPYSQPQPPPYQPQPPPYPQ
eukprot:CAMPEP_0172189756 /NCGR_PEP_ID=MMETSP1050-20130122/22707_1 /TAXON_ID=233186 /ORGANISM="Cryptomonas curvata, Strain CCAP979/52" /LENGTH=133 /DNA_ID=CAMNT_0012864499 /DNA_START=55 /DNA_END=453 /DNA_ORIENTATION=+